MIQHKDLLIQARDCIASRCGTNADERKPGGLLDLMQAAIDAPEDAPVSAQCKFDSDVIWSRCTVEHHNLVKSEPENWPNYQTRLLYPHPHPAHAKPRTDEQIDAVTVAQWGEQIGAMLAAYRAYARAIEAAHGITEVKP